MGQLSPVVQADAVGSDLRPEDQTALRDLFQLHASWLVTVIRKKGGGDFTEEIVQETYLRLARGMKPIAPAHPRGLLLHIATNILRDIIRNKTRRSTPKFALALLANQALSTKDTQLEAVFLRQIIGSLPPACRDTFVLHRFGGMPYKEIATLRKTSVKTVERRMSQALALCAASLRA